MTKVVALVLALSMPAVAMAGDVTPKMKAKDLTADVRISSQGAGGHDAIVLVFAATAIALALSSGGGKPAAMVAALK